MEQVIETLKELIAKEEDNPIQCLLNEETEKKKRSEENLPRVLAAKRLKFYKAIGKSDLIEIDDSEVNSEDENLSLECLFWTPLIKVSSDEHIVFDDSVVIEKFKKIKCPQFKLREYINAVKWLYHNWLGTDSNVIDLSFSNTLLYLLAHSRDFNEPSKNLYSFFEEGTEEILVHVDDAMITDNMPGDTKYVRKLNKLIEDLLCEYNENKYQQLNLNVTYLILLIARRIVKSEKEFKRALLSKKTHQDFATLCPNPLDTDIPQLSETNKLNFEMMKPVALINLVLYGYLNSKGKTRRIFRQTCINHMEYNGLGLAKLFYEVAKLYAIDDYKLWDIMSNYRDCCQAMFSLADLAHVQNEMTNSVPPKTYKLFPHCRLLLQSYHSNLTSKHYKNFIACYALAVLIDLKLGLETSFARKAHWTNSFSPIWTGKGENIARNIYKKINNDLP